MFNRKIGTISKKIHTPYEGMYGLGGGTPTYIKEVTGTMYIDLTDAVANILLELKAYGGTEQDLTPTPATPVDIVCNNGAIKVNSQGQIYTDGTTETITDELGNTATAEMLLKIGDYADEQEILSGNITRNVGIKVLDGTERWTDYTVAQGELFRTTIDNSVSNGKDILGVLCNAYQISATGTRTSGTLSGSATNYDFINDNYTTLDAWIAYLADQYTNGTPIIIVYPLATPTTETVAGQTMNIQAGNNTIEITQSSINNLQLYAKYKSTSE